jgi:hypothetical protein
MQHPTQEVLHFDTFFANKLILYILPLNTSLVFSNMTSVFTAALLHTAINSPSLHTIFGIIVCVMFILNENIIYTPVIKGKFKMA